MAVIAGERIIDTFVAKDLADEYKVMLHDTLAYRAAMGESLDEKWKILRYLAHEEQVRLDRSMHN